MKWWNNFIYSNKSIDISIMRAAWWCANLNLLWRILNNLEHSVLVVLLRLPL